MPLYFEVTSRPGVLSAHTAAAPRAPDAALAAPGKVHGDAGERALVEGVLEASPVVGVTDDAEEGVSHMRSAKMSSKPKIASRPKSESCFVEKLNSMPLLASRRESGRR